MNFPIEDIVKNVRQFVTSVKRATGNQKDPESDNKSSKPGALNCRIALNQWQTVGIVNAITRIVMSSTQAPSIQISDL